MATAAHPSHAGRVRSTAALAQRLGAFTGGRSSACRDPTQRARACWRCFFRALQTGFPACAPGTWPCGAARSGAPADQHLVMSQSHNKKQATWRGAPCAPVVSHDYDGCHHAGGGRAGAHALPVCAACGRPRERAGWCRAGHQQSSRGCQQRRRPLTWREDGGALHRRRHAARQLGRRLLLGLPQALHPRFIIVGALLRAGWAEPCARRWAAVAGQRLGSGGM